MPTSCLDVKERCPQCKSGVYEIGTDSSNVNFVYCTFENSYCNVTGPWVNWLDGISLNLVHFSLVDSSCLSMEQSLLVGSEQEHLLVVNRFLCSLPLSRTLRYVGE